MLMWAGGEHAGCMRLALPAGAVDDRSPCLLASWMTVRLQPLHCPPTHLADGGGMKGMATVRLLRELERHTGKRVWELFDLIGEGT